MSDSLLHRRFIIGRNGEVRSHKEHERWSEHLANERTHLAYVRTAISLISLGITVNRFSLYLQERDALPSAPRGVALLGGAATAGAGMVIYGLVLMLAASHRYHAVETAIQYDEFRSDRSVVTLVSVSVVLAAAAAIFWMFW